MPKFFELIASSKEGQTEPRFRVYVELREGDKDFWESHSLGTPEGRSQMEALRNSLSEVLPNETELSVAPVSTSFENDTDRIIGKAEPVIAKDGRRAWIARE